MSKIDREKLEKYIKKRIVILRIAEERIAGPLNPWKFRRAEAEVILREILSRKMRAA